MLFAVFTYRKFSHRLMLLVHASHWPLKNGLTAAAEVKSKNYVTPSEIWEQWPGAKGHRLECPVAIWWEFLHDALVTGEIGLSDVLIYVVNPLFHFI